MDFPKFFGDNPRVWNRQCRKYFIINQLKDCERMVIVGMHLESSAEHWYLDNVEGKEGMGTVY